MIIFGLMTIKKITIQDIESLKEISKLTFIETYSSKNSYENMTKYLENEFSTEKITNDLTNPNIEFYFAILNKIIVGYLKVNFKEAQTEIKDENALEIERIYVLKEFHRKRIGQALYEKTIELAIKKEMEYIWLGVWEQNHKAIRFYEKNNFIAFDKHVFMLGNDKQTDIMMKLDIKKA
ncbi:GNAT family N-acetyltransferase [Tenacibaculum halocynthiae]|uniref:GNAT family N-acetyltransferase n=1 Tax=Tenacibaculum halocynthiae TaxID=1254437 RepID=UPI003D65F527